LQLELHADLHITRWRPLVQWLLAIPHYFVLAALFVAACVGIIVGLFGVLVTGEYPGRIRDFIVAVYGYSLRVEAYVGFLTDRYPPFSLGA
jgi:hypothetical protein